MRNTVKTNITKICKRIFVFFLVFNITLIGCVSHHPEKVNAAGLGVGTLEAFYYMLQSLELGVSGYGNLTHDDFNGINVDSPLYQLFVDFKKKFLNALDLGLITSVAMTKEAGEILWNKAFEGDHSALNPDTGELVEDAAAEYIAEDDIVLVQDVTLSDTGAEAGSGEATKGLSINKDLYDAMVDFCNSSIVNRNNFSDLDASSILQSYCGFNPSYSIPSSLLTRFSCPYLIIFRDFSNSYQNRFYVCSSTNYFSYSYSDGYIYFPFRVPYYYFNVESDGSITIKGDSSSTALYPKALSVVYSSPAYKSYAFSLSDLSYSGSEEAASSYVERMDAIAIPGTAVGDEVDADENQNSVVIPFPGVTDIPDIGSDVTDGTGEGTGEGSASAADVLEGIEDVALDSLAGYMGEFNGKFDFLKNKFPFCIPFDLVAAVKSLGSSLPQAPFFHFEYHFDSIDYTWTFDVDLSDYEEYIEIFREGFFLIFLVGLMLVTSRLIKWV